MLLPRNPSDDARHSASADAEPTATNERKTGPRTHRREQPEPVGMYQGAPGDASTWHLASMTGLYSRPAEALTRMSSKLIARISLPPKSRPVTFWNTPPRPELPAVPRARPRDRPRDVNASDHAKPDGASVGQTAKARTTGKADRPGTQHVFSVLNTEQTVQFTSQKIPQNPTPKLQN